MRPGGERVLRPPAHVGARPPHHRHEAVAFLRRLGENGCYVLPWRPEPFVGVRGARQAAVLPDPPEVQPHERRHQKGKEEDVQDIEPDQGVLPHGTGAEEECLLESADVDVPGDPDGIRQLPRRLGDVGADRHGPVGELVPGKQVSAERKAERQDKKHEAEQPVHLPGLPVGGGIEDPGHVEQHGDHHQVGAPAVDIAHEPAGGDDVMDVLDRLVGQHGGRLVIEHEEQAGHRQEQERGGADESEPHRVRPAKAPPVDPRAVDMQEQVLEDRFGAGTVGHRRTLANEAVPHRPGDPSEVGYVLFPGPHHFSPFPFRPSGTCQEAPALLRPPRAPRRAPSSP